MRFGRATGRRAPESALGWLAAGGLTAVALIRAFGSETRPLLVGVQAIAVWLLTPAYPLLVGSVTQLQRHSRAGKINRVPRALTAVAVALAAVQGVLLLTMRGRGAPGTTPVGAVALRIVTANVLVHNQRMVALARELVSTDADVLLLQEVTPEHLAVIAESPLWAVYPYRALDARAGYHGSAIFSRLPLAAGGPIAIAGAPMLDAQVVTRAGRVLIVNVHVAAPVDQENAVLWRRQHAELARLVAGSPGLILLAGDFNATLDHRPLRRLLETGLRDAFVQAGRGYGATWPSWDGIVPPVMRIDHVLVGRGIVVRSIADQKSVGSDHRRLVVDLALSPQAP